MRSALLRADMLNGGKKPSSAVGPNLYALELEARGKRWEATGKIALGAGAILTAAASVAILFL